MGVPGPNKLVGLWFRPQKKQGEQIYYTDRDLLKILEEDDDEFINVLQCFDDGWESSYTENEDPDTPSVSEMTNGSVEKFVNT